MSATDECSRNQHSEHVKAREELLKRAEPFVRMTIEWIEEAAPGVNLLAEQWLEDYEGLNPASESGGTGENLVARVQQIQHLLDKGDEVELIAYMLGRSVEDVRRVVGSQ